MTKLRGTVESNFAIVRVGSKRDNWRAARRHLLLLGNGVKTIGNIWLQK